MTKRLLCVFFLCGSVAAQDRSSLSKRVDPNDPIERFAVLAPGGPMIIEVEMRIDGQPFRQAREKLNDEMYAAVDTDNDGTATWKEALQNNRFTLNRIRFITDQQLMTFAKSFDMNRNDQVDREEVRKFLERFNPGNAFVLKTGVPPQYRLAVSGRFGFLTGEQANVHELLDTDENGLLDTKEIAAAPTRLKSRDANDNDLSLPSEINGANSVATVQQAIVSRRQNRGPQLVIHLGPTTNATAIFTTIQTKYKNKDGDILAARFSSQPKLFALLDENKDGKLQHDEMLALNEVEPHIAVALEFPTADGVKKLTLKSFAPEMTKTNESNDTISVKLPGVKFLLTATSTVRSNRYATTGKAYLNRYDKDKNGYLEKEELDSNFSSQFAMWDADKDGKVFSEEIVASFSCMQRPQMSQVRAMVVNQRDQLFQTLDQSGDERLSLREMRTASAQIRTLDKNKDDRITPEEIPVTLNVTFGLGSTSLAGYRSLPAVRRGTNQPSANDAPEWFTRIDRNGDGDLTLREFLGNKEQFKKLDGDGDGFIEPIEAKSAQGS